MMSTEANANQVGIIGLPRVVSCSAVASYDAPSILTDRMVHFFCSWYLSANLPSWRIPTSITGSWLSVSNEARTENDLLSVCVRACMMFMCTVCVCVSAVEIESLEVTDRD